MNDINRMTYLIRRGVRKNEDFYRLTTEVTKIDRHKIQEYKDNGLNFANFIIPWAIKEDWGVTYHYFQRIKDYHNKPMKNYDSVELNDYEYSIMNNHSKFISYLRWVFKNRYITLTEIGFNSVGQICKTGYILPAPGNTDLSGSQNNKGRLLFVCLGVNRYIKTWYITEGDKYREIYQSSNSSVKYIR